MKFLSNVFRVAYFSIFLKLLHGYLLFAANLDDFHTIAKKLVPEEFADNLKKIAFNPAARDRPYDYESSVETEKVYELRETNDNSQKRGKKTEKIGKIRLNTDATIDFDELVERVKKRIEKELKDKLTFARDAKTKIDETTKLKFLTTRKQVEDDKSEYIDEITDRPTTYEHVVTTKAVTERYEYADALESYVSNNNNKKKKMTKEKDYDEFKKIDMVKKDSYEDYKVPPKDVNIYSSKENKRFKVKKSVKSKDSVRKPLKVAKSRNKQTVEEPDFDEEIKARTENINYDDNLSLSNVKKFKLGTFRPTRERYTVVTPNYVSPMGAERYDFDEPLPENDRQREKLKYFGNPPARINKKVFI